MLQSGKVRLRDLTEKDLDDIHRWRNDPEVTDFLANLKISKIQVDAWFSAYERSGSGRFLAIETEKGHFIGYMGLRDIDWGERIAMMDIIIGEKDYWGQGYGEDAVSALLRFAFYDMQLSKVVLAVLPFNTRAIKCYEKCGFRRAGFFPEKYFRRGGLWQPYRMEVTPTQFALAQKVSPA